MHKQGPSEQGSLFYLTGVCLVATLGGLLFGYDTAVISGAIGFLQKRFLLDPTGMGWAASCALVGCIAGVVMAGEVSDRLGRRRALMLAAVLFFVSAVGTAVPRTLAEFIVFRIIGGVGVGIASMTSPMYIAEIAPAHLRGRLVSVNQLAIVSGMLIVYFVNYYIAGQGGEAWNTQTGWRWMFGSEALPALALLVLMFFVPETPRWLCMRGRHDAARTVLQRVSGSAHAGAALQEIETTVRRESESVTQLLRPGMRKVLVIGVTLAVLQQVTGINVFLYYAPEIFKKFGQGSDAALLQTVAVGAANLLFTLVAIGTVDKVGRKPLLLIGAAGMGISLFAIGFGAYLERIESWALVFILGYIGSFALSIGPVVWVVLSEIFPTRIRGRAMAIATFFLWTANFAVSQTFPMMAGNAWLVNTFHGGFPFWIYGSLCVVTIVFVLVYIPETKGKTLEEIERMWGATPREPATTLEVAP
ncbi:sugar porter family MFS transporter [Roseovarius pacificus]|uniref:sugar porter family MFS transporter n=1 Tax=Roseovarius pacificus TaxID=337701 RepID=UPI002A18C796|nr:sugar porter family MFS transporter [Roseovarius pacificus]